MARVKKKETLTPEERLQAALVPESEQPYPVPRNWCWTQLGTYIDFATDYVANGSFASLKQNVAYYKEENYAILVKTQDFSNSFTEDLTYTDKRGYDFLKKSVLYGGELILSNIGSIGKVFRVPHLNKPMTLAPNSIMIKCYRETDYDLLYYYFLSPFGTEQLYSITTGTAVKKFNKTDLKTICLPLPPLSEQQRIVDSIESLFAKLDAAKQKAQDALDSFETRKAAILHKAFTGELIGKHSTATTTLEEITTCIRIGPFGSALHKEDYILGGVPVVNPKHIVQQKIVPEEKTTVSVLKAEELSSYILQKNDIILGRRGDMGRSAPVTDLETGWLCGTGSMIIRLKSGYNAKFYSQIIASQAAVRYLEENSVGSTMKNLNEKVVRLLPIPDFTVDEQLEIVRILDNLLAKEQQAKEVAEKVLEQIDLIKKAILARAFRGELGTNNPSEESAVELLKVIV